MSTRNLSYLFAPRSIAVIGASSRPHSVGATVLGNIIDGGYKGAIYPVNLKYETLRGLTVCRRVRTLPQAPDLAVICTPAATVPALVDELGRHGTPAAVVLSAGLDAEDSGHRSLTQAMLDAARPSLLRILGPNCVGLISADIALNATFAHTGALPGSLAFVSQSGALMTGVLDWAKTRGIGFSRFISLGDSADVDFGDILDYLAGDPATKAILLYVEGIRHARKFMSAARAAARSKPVLIVKAGRTPESAKAATSHTGALAGVDAVYDAAIRRAGMLRVLTTDELFAAVETLANARPLKGDRLSIMTNGGGPGVMATDELVALGGCLSALSDATRQALDAVLPSNWSHGNPVDIIGDAPAERYVQTMHALLSDPGSDAILFIHAPTAIVPSAQIAADLLPVVREASHNIIACWLGGDGVADARRAFAGAGIPTYDTPESAVRGFMQIVQYRRNQDLLMEAPSSVAAEFTPDRPAARAIVEEAQRCGTVMLSAPQAKALLSAYGIPFVPTETAATAEEAAQCAERLGFPVALKLLSPDITHKSDVGGVVLDLETADSVRSAATAMTGRVGQLVPGARVAGFTVQPMARRPEAQEVIVGVSTDPVFGPVILFGQGGVAVEVTADRAIGLPPLNMALARDLVSRTRVARLLAGFRQRPPADIDAVCLTLVQVSQLIADIGEIAELDINPLLADHKGVVALDARVRLAPVPAPVAGVERFAIRPYPRELEEWIGWQGGRVLLRPIRPEDAAAHIAFFQALDPEDVWYRAFSHIKEISPSQLARLTQIDYDREMALIATRKRERGGWETLGVVRAASDPDNVNAEFAIVVRSDLKGRGLGSILLDKIIAYCQDRGIQRLTGETLCHNRQMVELAKKAGFSVANSIDPENVELRLELNASPLSTDT